MFSVRGGPAAHGTRARGVQELRNHFRGTHKWELKEVVERPQLVHMTAFGLTTKKDLCAQAIVRVHLKQARWRGSLACMAAAALILLLGWRRRACA